MIYVICLIIGSCIGISITAIVSAVKCNECVSKTIKIYEDCRKGIEVRK